MKDREKKCAIKGYNRKGIIGISIILLCIIVGVLLQEPIAQSLEYHDFSDNRSFLSIPNFYNVLSNLPFIIVGFMGLYSLFVSNKITKLDKLKVGYCFLFLGLLLIGFGSGYYHLWPSNQTLVWDRLPMTLAFMALIAIIIAEYFSVDVGKRLLYPLLMIGGASVLYWDYTESNGAGDLRYYILVQFLPLIAIPLILLFMKPAFSYGNRYWWLFLTYILAKLFEHFDTFVFEVLTAISDHIPVPLEDARFRKSERFMIKAHFFIKGHSLKKKCNAEYDLLSLPQGAGLEALYAALLISTIE